MDSVLNAASNADSILLITFGMIVASLLLLRPVIKMWLESKEKTAQAQREHEKIQKDNELAVQREILKVVSSSVEVNTALKTLIEQNYTHCDDCKAQQMTILTKIQEDISFITVQLKYVGKRGGDVRPEAQVQ